MIICGECGTRNASGTQFCTECSTFLEWDGSPAVGSADPQPPATDAAPPPAGGTGQPADQRPIVPQPVTAARSGGTVTADSTQAAGAERTAAPSGAEQGGPRPVRPGETEHRYQSASPDEPDTIAPGEIRCPHCRAGNAATRKFCRSCAGALRAQPGAARPSWWRRLVGRLAGRRWHEAGTRRPVRGPRRRLRRIVGIALTCLVLAAAATVLPTRGLIARGVTAVHDRISDHVPVTPVKLRASSEAPAAAARNISDGASNRYWAPSKGPVGAWVEADFPRPVRLLDVLVTPGVSADKQQFLTQGRPSELAVQITDKHGKVTLRTFKVHDAPGAQTFSVRLSDVTGIRFTIVAAYGMGRGRRCAIGELEFYIRD